MTVVKIPAHYEFEDNKEYNGVDGTVFLYPRSHGGGNGLTDEQRKYFSSLSDAGVVLSEAHPSYAPEIKYDVVFVPNGLKVEFQY